MSDDGKGSSEPTYFSAYGCKIGGTPWGLALLLERGFVLEPAAEGAKYGEQVPNVTPEVVVTMPWSLAKAIHQMLGETIAKYEALEDVQVQLPKSFLSRVAAEP